MSEVNDQFTNKLIMEKSPYLLQHAHNPVDWYPWGTEAFTRAVNEDKPIFLSIGYSCCHWCHVMERESFEDEEVAKILNSNFVSIKVDREERPDIDHIYMSVCQMLTGHGGWPLTIIMTPDQKPFFAGTYFPKNNHMGMSGLMTILERVNAAWSNKREALIDSGESVTKAFSENPPSNKGISSDVIEEAYMSYEEAFDEKYGGFGDAPKFPTPHTLLFLLRYWSNKKDPIALDIVKRTLNSMHGGGIYDHIGFGFSRYSTDRKWLVPHFEKMLYDNALLAIAYLEGYQATRENKYADVAKQIFTYVLRDMTSPEGGFYSAEDADSEGVEGKFYVWSHDEIIDALGKEEGEKFCKYYDITEKGNFEGKNIPNLIKSTVIDSDKEFIEASRQKLFKVRENRIHPYKDDKILTSWNGLMIAALSMASRILGIKEYEAAAKRSVDFIFENLIREDGRLFARFRDGEASYPAYVDDYSFLIWGLIELYETSYNELYLNKAINLSKDLIKYFWDEQNGGLYIYGSDSEQLIARPKEVYDGATPSGNSVAALNFLRLSRLTGDHSLEEKANQILKAFSREIKKHPAGYSFLLIAAMFKETSAKEVIVVSNSIDDDARNMLNIINERYSPFTVSILYSKDNEELKKIIPFIKNYEVVDNKATAYVCKNFSCQTPVNDLKEFRESMSN
ncbi:MAG: thioredoxin domain-containing protein [Bacillota bacterium]|nr:thioredoxin domain-containing protein [Bacillota bacterium]